MQSLKNRARQLQTELYALTIAYRDPRMPLPAKILAAVVIGYAFSPIDLIPDPIPVLGYLDDLLLIPLGITLVLRLIPPEVMKDARQRAQQRAQESNGGGIAEWIAAAVILLIWIGLIALVLRGLW